MARGRLLILSPRFHGYWESIHRAFSELGWEVSTHCYDNHAGLRAKAHVKLMSELPSRVGRRAPHTMRAAQDRLALAAVRALKPDRILVIKGDELGEVFWDSLDRANVPMTLWLYDELRRTRHDSHTLSQFDCIASYSRMDVTGLAARGIPATFVPLAYDQRLPFEPQPLREITLVGARYPKRQVAIEALHRASVPVRAYGRDWSGHWADRLRTWRLSAFPFPTERDLTLAEAYGVMAGSAGTLNIHGDQDGFTMRTFEAAGVGGLQFIDRTDVGEYYEMEREVLTFDSNEELIALAQRALTDRLWGARIRSAARARTLSEHTFDHRARALEATWA